MIQTFCTYNLGDNIVQLNYLRKLAKRYPDQKFIHAVNGGLLPQLKDVIADVSTISLIDLSQKDPSAIDAWKNRNGDFFAHVKRDDWAAFYVEFFARLSADLGVENPITQPSDLLFDYPAIAAKSYPEIDFLIINSTPLSGQFRKFWPEQLDLLIGKLKAKGYSVVTTSRSSHEVACTQTYVPPMTITDIGALSRRCKYIFGIATGPIWPTFNIWNLETVKLRVILLDGERIDIAPNTYHVESIDDGMKLLQERGLL